MADAAVLNAPRMLEVVENRSVLLLPVKLTEEVAPIVTPAHHHHHHHHTHSLTPRIHAKSGAVSVGMGSVPCRVMVVPVPELTRVAVPLIVRPVRTLVTEVRNAPADIVPAALNVNDAPATCTRIMHVLDEQ
jgi:hypothetical protein